MMIEILFKYFGVIKEVMDEIENHYIKADFKKSKFFPILSVALSVAILVSFMVWSVIVSENILLCILIGVFILVMFPWSFFFVFYGPGALFVRLFELLLEPLFKKRTKVGMIVSYFLGVVVAAAFWVLLICLSPD
jgi:hypothetical protein